MTDKDRLYSLLYRLLLLSLSGLILYALRRVLLPVALSLGLASLICPAARGLSRRTRLPRRLCTLLLLLLVAGAIGGGLWYLLFSIWREAKLLYTALESNPDAIASALARIGEAVRKTALSLPLPNEGGELWQSAGTLVSRSLSSLCSALLSRLPAWLWGQARSVPSVLLSVGFTAIATLYAALDLEHVRTAALSLLPTRCRASAQRLVTASARAFRRFARAYLLLFLLTLSVCAVGLSLLGTPYALLLSVLIAAVDALPVLGAGLILLPWAAVCLIGGHTVSGVSLLALYASLTLLRQLLEPKIMGNSLGLPPFLTLVASFTGLTLFGVGGMLLVPLLLSILQEYRRTP